MPIAGNAAVQNTRTTFETLLETANMAQKETGVAERLAVRKDGRGGTAIQFTVPGAGPDYERWAGEKNFRGFRKLKTTCTFDKYHKSMGLQRQEVVHDQDGSTGARMSTWMADAGYVFDKVIIDKLKTNPTVADGTALLANSHTYGTFDNLTTDALNFDTFDAGRAAMRSQTDEFGEFPPVMPDTLLVHTDEERIALEITQADTRPVSVGTGGEITINGSGLGATSLMNVYMGSVMVIVTPRWTSGDWLLIDSRFPPIGLGVWRDPEPHILDSMDDTPRFTRDEFLYSVEADLNTVGLTHHGCYGKIS